MNYANEQMCGMRVEVVCSEQHHASVGDIYYRHKVKLTAHG